MYDFWSDAARQDELARWFPHTPQLFWSRTCVGHNGFFGNHTSSKSAVPNPRSSLANSSTTQTGPSSPSRSATDHQESFSTYFRLTMKFLGTSGPQEQPSPPEAPTKEYTWHELGFMSFSSDSRSTMLCFGVSTAMINSLQDTLFASSEQLRGPFGLHVPLLEELVRLYDRSTWAMANRVREVEMVS
jgi:hypothetical protein